MNKRSAKNCATRQLGPLVSSANHTSGGTGGAALFPPRTRRHGDKTHWRDTFSRAETGGKNPGCVIFELFIADNHISMTDTSKSQPSGPGSNQDQEGVYKEPGEEQGRAEQVTIADLKGKKVDGDPEKSTDQPVKK